ncbi:MAG TPA: hypothetical protein VJ302_10180 [Blastocatellia bacterium]|nr:hypothetical protein [Blastocatellia bacterium]
MLDILHYKDFAPHVNTNFRIQINPGRTLEIELIKVEDRSCSPRQELFILTFRAPSNTPPLQQLFQMSHHSLGTGIMFLVPISRDEDGLIYEAVFNRNHEG